MGEVELDLDPDTLFTCDTERTFQFEDGLPSLPVPSLQHTLDRYLDSGICCKGVFDRITGENLAHTTVFLTTVRPLVTDEEYRKTEDAVRQFATGIGKDLHAKLVEKGNQQKNWLEQWWLDSYLDFRLPLAPLTNIGGQGLKPAPYNKAQEGTQIAKAGLMVHCHLRFWQLIRREQLAVARDGKGCIFSMTQLLNVFNTCRVPGLQRDKINFYFKTDSDGEAPRNIVVMCRGRIFSLDAFDDCYEQLTVPELQQQFQFIRDRCDSLPMGPGIGTLTADYRSSWAKNRSRLIALSPRNYENLELIQKSIMVVALDDAASPLTETELFRELWSGDPSNRWCDKGLNILMYRNGLATLSLDHAPFDGIIVLALSSYVDMCLKRCQGKWQGEAATRELIPPRELEFVVDDVIMQSINTARETFHMFGSNIDFQILQCDGYGKKYLQRKRVHPDTYMQLALQYAYYRLYRKPAPTYETGTTRKFYHGRTETLRSCTIEALDWCRVMVDSSAQVQKKFSYFMSAVEKHDKLMSEAKENQGCDRHLFGLSVIAKESGIPLPQLFTDPAYTKSGGNANFVLSTSLSGYTFVLGCVPPMTEHGYSCFYRIWPESIGLIVTAWKSSDQTSAAWLGQSVNDCLKDMKHMLDSVREQPSRL